MDRDEFVGQLLRSIERQLDAWVEDSVNGGLVNLSAGVSVTVPTPPGILRAFGCKDKRAAEVREVGDEALICHVNRDATLLALSRRDYALQLRREQGGKLAAEQFLATFPGFF